MDDLKISHMDSSIVTSVVDMLDKNIDLSGICAIYIFRVYTWYILSLVYHLYIYIFVRYMIYYIYSRCICVIEVYMVPGGCAPAQLQPRPRQAPLMRQIARMPRVYAIDIYIYLSGICVIHIFVGHIIYIFIAGVYVL